MKGSLRAPLLCFVIEWDDWYARLPLSRTFSGETYTLTLPRPDVMVKPKQPRGPFRNPLIFARELQAEMLRHNLTRVQLGRRHNVTSDRITQWLCLLKLSEEKQREILALGDHWDRRVVTERRLRNHTSVALKPANLE